MNWFDQIEWIFGSSESSDRICYEASFCYRKYVVELSLVASATHRKNSKGYWLYDFVVSEPKRPSVISGLTQEEIHPSLFRDELNEYLDAKTRAIDKALDCCLSKMQLFVDELTALQEKHGIFLFPVGRMGYPARIVLETEKPFTGDDDAKACFSGEHFYIDPDGEEEGRWDWGGSNYYDFD